MGVRNEFVDRPLVIRVLSVFDRSDTPVRSDQEVRWQSETPSGGFNRPEHAALRAAAPERRTLTGHRRTQRTRGPQRSQSAFDTKAPIELAFGVSDQRERQL